MAIRIPRTLAGQLDVEDGTSIELQVREGELIVRPVWSMKLSLREPPENCKPSQLHGETDFGEDVGRERYKRRNHQKRLATRPSHQIGNA